MSGMFGGGYPSKTDAEILRGMDERLKRLEKIVCLSEALHHGMGQAGGWDLFKEMQREIQEMVIQVLGLKLTR